MTKEEIKALINAKIKGQGSQVDLGGALPTIIEEVLDSIPDIPASASEILIVDLHDDFDSETLGAHSIIRIILRKGGEFVTILPVSTLGIANALYQYQEEWRMVSADADTTGIATWADLCNYMEANSKPIITEDSIPKPFHLLANPTSDMTTLEELATTGLTKEVFADMAAGKYTAIISPNQKFYPIQDAHQGYLLYGYDFTHNAIDAAYVMSIEIIDELVRVTFIDV